MVLVWKIGKFLSSLCTWHRSSVSTLVGYILKLLKGVVDKLNNWGGREEGVERERRDVQVVIQSFVSSEFG